MLHRSAASVVLLVILTALGAPFSVAQAPVDSLRGLLEEAQGKARLDLLSELAAELVHSDRDAALRAGHEALEESSARNYTRGQLRALCTLGHAYYHAGDEENAIGSIQRALRLPAGPDTRRERGLCYNELGNAYQEFGRDEETVASYLQAARVLEAGHLREEAARAHTNLGLFYWQRGAFGDALTHYQEALQHYEEAGASRQVAYSLNNSGVIYYQWGEYERALEYYERSRDLREALHDEEGVALTLNNIGLVYQEWEQFDHALRVHLDAYARIDTTQTDALGYTLSNLGSVHQALGDYDEALAYFERSEEVYQAVESAGGLIMNLVSIGQLRREMGEEEASLRILREARRRAASLDMPEHEARALKELGRAHQATGSLEKAIGYYESSQALSRQMGKRNLVKDNAELLSSAYEQLGDYQQALEHHRAHQRLRDSLFDERSQWLLADMKSRYAAAQAEQENVVLRAAQERQEMILLLALLLLIVVLLAAVMLHRAHRQTRKANEELVTLNERLTLLNEQIARQRDEQRELLHILSHDLANPLGNVRGCLEIMLEEPEAVDELGPMALKVANSGIDIISMVREMRTLEDGKLEMEAVALRAAVDDVALVLKRRLTNKAISLVNDVPEGTTVVAERRSLVNSVLANILTNAIKFSHAGQRIVVRACAARQGRVLLTVRDYGIGMPPEVLGRLFDLDTSTSREGTAGEMGSGFGMPLVKKFVDLYGGLVEVRSHQAGAAAGEHGTEVRITLHPAAEASAPATRAVVLDGCGRLA